MRNRRRRGCKASGTGQCPREQECGKDCQLAGSVATPGVPIGFDIGCDRCGKLLAAPGALIFGPPGLLANNACEKLHICFSCWYDLRRFVYDYRVRCELAGWSRPDNDLVEERPGSAEQSAG